MSDAYSKKFADHHKHNLTQKQQKAAGAPVQGSVQEEHKSFLKTLFTLLDANEINPDDPQSLLKKDVYNSLSEEWQGKVDLALLNIANQVRLIRDLRAASKKKESIHLETMVEQLWEMKQRIEEHHDAFKF